MSQKRRRQLLARGRLTLIMGLFGVAFIFLTFGYMAWEQRQRLIERNEEDIASNAYFLADHTARLLEVTDLTLKQVVELIEGQDWNLIEASQPHWQHLSTIRETLPYVDNVWLADSTGKLRLTSAQFPTPSINIADRDAFRAQAPSDRGIYIGEPVIGRFTKQPTFMISRRLERQNNAFDGIISVTVRLSYFDDYWRKLRLPKGSRITLIRPSDGQVIVQYPRSSDGLTFAPIDKVAFDRALAANARSGTYSFLSTSTERVGAYHQVGELPLYIHVSIPENAYWGPWTIQMRLYGAFALIALLALIALTALASQQFREQAANEAFLQREVLLRTSELKAETTALEILNRTGRALAAELDIDRIVQNVVEAAVLLTGAQTGVFFVCEADAAEGGYDHQERHGHYANEEARAALSRLPIGQICAAVLAEGQILRSGDIMADPEFNWDSAGENANAGRGRIHSIMAVPVSSRTGTIQGILLFAHERPSVFTERAERLVTGLAAQAAIALENGRLYQEAQHEIDERRQAQNQQSFLIRELHHRVKNTLATVQAVVGATARATSNIDDFYKAFVGRIISLANTHSLLTEAVWQTAPLREILEKELRPYNDEKSRRIILDGPSVELPSDIAVPVGMAIHELTTNAAKYGALSESTGRVTVSWDVQGYGDDARLVLSWEERGGPEVSQPERQGFGSRLLHRVLTTQLNAKVEVDYDPAGLHVAIDAPLKSTATLRTPI